jgi:hypothetical protein
MRAKQVALSWAYEWKFRIPQEKGDTMDSVRYVCLATYDHPTQARRIWSTDRDIVHTRDNYLRPVLRLSCAFY